MATETCYAWMCHNCGAVQSFLAGTSTAPSFSTEQGAIEDLHRHWATQHPDIQADWSGEITAWDEQTDDADNDDFYDHGDDGDYDDEDVW